MKTASLNRLKEPGNKGKKEIRIMGILNVTPDSFYDGNRYKNKEQAAARCRGMIEAGADILDIGGESTRPGSERVSLEEEKERVLPVIEDIRKRSNILISIDTYKAEVAEEAVKAGANMVNDISALRFDSRMIEVLKKYPVEIVLMHMQGEPKNMQSNPVYQNVVEDIITFLRERIEFLENNGIAKERIIIDPGIGFGKTLQHNLSLLKYIGEFKKLGCRLLVGHSRKSFMGMILDNQPEERLFSSLSVSLWLYQEGVDILRVHDVKETQDVIKIWQEIENA